MDTKRIVYMIVSELQENRGRGGAEFGDETNIQEGGLEFDSLTVAEFSAGLERKLGKDPYSDGVFPVTIGDVIRFYS